MPRIGFIVNPVAGMGGAVGLKGTDGQVAEARRRGAREVAPDRALMTLRELSRDKSIEFLTCSGPMGEDELKRAGISNYTVLYRYLGESASEDTYRAARAIFDAGIDLILFCGGDGTARDIVSVIGARAPLLGIPAGVKMYSAVFAIDPAAAADIVLKVPDLPVRDGEVIDVDEEAYRHGELSTKVFGYVKVPYIPELTQLPKQIFEAADEERAKDGIAQFIREVMLPGVLYILGPGTTTERIASVLGQQKTLLGVDVMKDGVRVQADAGEQELLDLLSTDTEARIILSPLGAQGFILGRGNQQISSRIVRRVGVKGIILVSTPQKLAETPVLFIDTGDSALDAEFGDSIQVICGYRIAQRKRVHVHGHPPGSQD